jgi:hypothetical protein
VSERESKMSESECTLPHAPSRTSLMGHCLFSLPDSVEGCGGGTDTEEKERKLNMVPWIQHWIYSGNSAAVRR